MTGRDEKPKPGSVSTNGRHHKGPEALEPSAETHVGSHSHMQRGCGCVGGGAQGWKRGLMNPGSDTSHAPPSWREFPIDHTREKLVKI